MDPNPIKSAGGIVARVRHAVEPTLLRAGFRFDHRNDPRLGPGAQHLWIDYVRGQERLSLDWDDWKAQLSLSAVDVHGTVSEIAVANCSGARAPGALLERVDLFIFSVQRSPFFAAGAPAETDAAILRCVPGAPSCRTVLNPRWRTIDVVDVAKAIYEEKAFDRMAILADALMDAGCDDAEIIHHCRGPGPHVRGCWVVDLILGKK